VGCFIAFIKKMSIREFGKLACVSLRPKSEIAQHYMDKFSLILTGITLSIEVPEIIGLKNFYNND
jgi:hypothetical protein